MYNFMGNITKDNLDLYNRGEEIHLPRKSFRFTSIGEINELEKKLGDYSKKFCEAAVFVEWGQDYGGPSIGFKAHRKKEINEMLSRYETEHVNGIYPKIGLVIDYDLINEMRGFLKKDKSSRENRDVKYLQEYTGLISKGFF